MTETRLYKLGRIIFCLEQSDPNFAEDFDRLMAIHKILPDEGETIHRLSVTKPYNLRTILNQVLKLHLNCLWFDAACLISPGGKTIFFPGASGSGKSTTSMALAMGYGWKVLTEDMLLVDLNSARLIGIATPYSLKPGTAELLQRTIALTPEAILQKEWYPLDQTAAKNCELESKFDCIIMLKGHDSMKQLQIEQIHPMALIRDLLPTSNIMSVSGSPDVMTELISETPCYRFTNGTLRERIDAIIAIESNADCNSAKAL